MCGATCFTIRKGPAQIDRHHPIPKCHVDIRAVGFLKRREQSGVVDQDIDLAETLHGLGDQRLDGSLVADVENFARHRIRAVGTRDLVGRLLAIDDVGDHDATAFGGERARIMPANPLGAACNNRNAAVHPSHNATLLVQSCFFSFCWRGTR
jgi:hypothetical protein